MFFFDNNNNFSTATNGWKKGFFETAFNGFYQPVWNGTKFQYEYNELSYLHSLNIFLSNTILSEQDRRKLLYYYMAPFMDSSSENNTIDRMVSVMNSNNLYVNRVINSICNLYDNAPTREYNSGKFTEYITNSNINIVIDEVYKIAKLTGEIIVRPIILEGRLQFQYITNDQYRYDKYTDGTIKELWIHSPQVIKGEYIKELFEVWSDDSYKIISQNGKVYQNEPNIYKIIPFEILTLDVDSNFKSERQSKFWELIKAQLDNNRLALTEINTAIYNGFPIIAMINFEVPDKMSVAPGKIITVEGVNPDSTVPPYTETISPQAQYLDINELRNNNIKNALRTMNLPSSLLDESANLQSGVAMKIERIGLDEYRKSDEKNMQFFEKKFTEKIVAVLNSDARTNFNGITLDLKFNYTQIPGDAQQEFELNQQQFEAGLVTPLEYLQNNGINNKDITDNQQAIDYILENKKYVNQLNVFNTDAETDPRN